MLDAPARPPIPVWVKLAYTAFVAILVPQYLSAYGPTNFLYFCDVALLLTVVAVWTESALLVSACAVGILLPQLLWMADFLGSAVGLPITGMTGYMFNAKLPRVARFLSFFHFWLPIFLVWLLTRLGYDRRGYPLWAGIAVALIIVCYLFTPAPPAPADQPGLPVNINYVYGLSDDQAQTWMNPRVYVLLLLLVLQVGILLPTHLVLKRVFRQRS